MAVLTKIEKKLIEQMTYKFKRMDEELRIPHKTLNEIRAKNKILSNPELNSSNGWLCHQQIDKCGAYKSPKHRIDYFNGQKTGSLQKKGVVGVAIEEYVLPKKKIKKKNTIRRLYRVKRTREAERLVIEAYKENGNFDKFFKSDYFETSHTKQMYELIAELLKIPIEQVFLPESFIIEMLEIKPFHEIPFGDEVDYLRNMLLSHIYRAIALNKDEALKNKKFTDMLDSIIVKLISLNPHDISAAMRIKLAELKFPTDKSIKQQPSKYVPYAHYSDMKVFNFISNKQRKNGGKTAKKTSAK